MLKKLRNIKSTNLDTIWKLNRERMEKSNYFRHNMGWGFRLEDILGTAPAGFE